MKMCKANKQLREQYSKDLHKEANMKLGPTRLVPMDLFVIVDTDDIRKQVNILSKQLDMQQRQNRIQAKQAWVGRIRCGRRR